MIIYDATQDEVLSRGPYLYKFRIYIEAENNIAKRRTSDNKPIPTPRRRGSRCFPGRQTPDFSSFILFFPFQNRLWDPTMYPKFSCLKNAD